MSIERFIKLARAGRHPAASTGEAACAELMRAFAKIGDDVCLFDQGALDGACQFLRAMAGPFPTEESKETVYAVLRPFEKPDKHS